MPRHTLKQEFLISLCCSLVLAFVLGCNGSKTTRVIGENSKDLFSKLAVGTFSHVIPASPSHNSPLFALMFQTGAQTGSDVPESFQFTCRFDVGSGFLASIQPGQIVPVLGQLNTFPNDSCQSAFTAAQPPQVFWTTHTPVGRDAIYDVEPIFHAGTIQSLVVTVLTSSSQLVRCSDLSDTASVADGDVVLAYLDPYANTVTLYDNTSRLNLSCQLSGFPSGDTYLLLSVRFAKI